MYYNTIVLSGGSIKTLTTLGALQYCFDNELLSRNIKTYAGTSAGAILCYLLAIGYTPIELLCYFAPRDLFKSPHYFNIAGIFDGQGAVSFSDIHEHLEKLTIDKIGCLITLGDIQTRYNKTLIIAVYNYTKKHLEYLTPNTTPDMPCLSALRMSCSLPFIFSMYKYGDSYYVDGAIADNFPLGPVNSKDNKILGFHIDIFKDVYFSDQDTFTPQVYTLLSIPLIELEKQKLKDTSIEIIYLNSTKSNIISFNITSKEKLDMFSDGYQIAQDHFEKE